MKDRLRVRGWSIYDSGYYDDIQNMLFGEEDNMTLLDAISKGLVSEIIPEQCTGLKDKNGELIYEGDILRLVSETDKDEYVVNWYEHNAQLSLDVLNDRGQTDFDIIDSNYLEIIGNIHENPELLEEG